MTVTGVVRRRIATRRIDIDTDIAFDHHHAPVCLERHNGGVYLPALCCMEPAPTWLWSRMLKTTRQQGGRR